ncbi:MAG: class I SAM-dependent methyltransferase [Candidatus Thorarchaeota archaeon]
MEFSNVYEDDKRAEAYSKMEFPGTYYLAYRDLPTIISQHVQGRTALDFGCGSGRSTRFLQKIGFHTIGVDISDNMIRKAKELDLHGDYRVIEEADFSQFNDSSFDLILAAFPFDNIPTMEQKVRNLKAMARVMKENGVFINLVSSPEIYYHEWASFSTKDFPENRHARSGGIVRIIQCDTDDKRPVEDVIWTHDAYLETYSDAQMEVIKVYRPLGKADEPIKWVNEAHIPPWVIYILRKSNR